MKVEPLAIDVSCTDDALRVVLADAREISVPLIWSPRLQKATPKLYVLKEVFRHIEFTTEDTEDTEVTEETEEKGNTVDEKGRQ